MIGAELMEDNCCDGFICSNYTVRSWRHVTDKNRIC